MLWLLIDVIVAGHYFGVKMVKVGMRGDLGMDVEQARRAITPNTVLIIASAPQFPHGILPFSIILFFSFLLYFFSLFSFSVVLSLSFIDICEGVVDPIEELGALAVEKGLPLHVDACIGGFMLPWVEQLGYRVFLRLIFHFIATFLSFPFSFLTSLSFSFLSYLFLL